MGNYDSDRLLGAFRRKEVVFDHLMRVSRITIAVVLVCFPGILFGKTNPHTKASSAPSCFLAPDGTDFDSIARRIEKPNFPIVRLDSESPQLPVSDGNQTVSIPTRIDPYRTAVVASVLAGGLVVLNMSFERTWWRDQRTSFHFHEDEKYARNVDKIGHIYGTIATSFAAASLLEWAGFSENASTWGGAAIGLMSELYIEYQDGRSALWGFDRYDAAADLLGGAYFVARRSWPSLSIFDMKFSYYPSPRYGTMGEGNFRNKKQTFMDDYEGHTYWFGLRINELLPAGAESVWPDVLGIAIGIGVDELARGGETEVLLGLDYNLMALPGDGSFWKKLKEALNYIRFPAPAVRISPSFIWYGIYF